MFLNKVESMSTVTKKVIDDFNRMDDKQFMAKYFCSKLTYAKRVAKYGDPYITNRIMERKKNTIGYESEEAKRVSIKSLRTLDVYTESRLSLFFAKYSTAFMEVIFCGGQETH